MVTDPTQIESVYVIESAAGSCAYAVVQGASHAMVLNHGLPPQVTDALVTAKGHPGVVTRVRWSD